MYGGFNIRLQNVNLEKCIGVEKYNKYINALNNGYIYYVHSTKYLPSILQDYNGRLKFFSDGTVLDKFYDVSNQLSLHAYTNDLVHPHPLGSWELYPYCIILNGKYVIDYIRSIQWIDTDLDYDIDIIGENSCWFVVPKDTYERISKILESLGVTNINERLKTYNRPSDDMLVNPENYLDVFEIVSSNEQGAFTTQSTDPENKTYYKIKHNSEYELLRNGVESLLLDITNKKNIPLLIKGTIEQNGTLKTVIMGLQKEIGEQCFVDYEDNFYDKLNIYNISSDGNILDEGRRHLINILKQIKKVEQCFGKNSCLIDGNQSNFDQELAKIITFDLNDLKSRKLTTIHTSIEYQVIKFLRNLYTRPFSTIQFPHLLIIQNEIINKYTTFLRFKYDNNINILSDPLKFANEIFDIYAVFFEILDEFDYDYIQKYENLLNTFIDTYFNQNVQHGGKNYHKYLKYKNKYIKLKYNLY